VYLSQRFVSDGMAGDFMQQIHVPVLGPKYWTALCLASIFGANMGDYFAHELGLGHVAGLPILAAALGAVLIAERFDRSLNTIYYWAAIILIRTAATNSADFLAGDLKIPRAEIIPILAIMLAVSLWLAWQFAWRLTAGKSAGSSAVLRADPGYWVSMFLAGTLGTVIADYVSHLGSGDAGGAFLLCPVVAALFLIGRNGLMLWTSFYWLTVVAIRAAGTSVGDTLAGRHMLGLPLSTLVTGILFVALLTLWKDATRSDAAAESV
jgi:uncharacterized membrane-anchored protein